jgi:hypothetical protein
VSVPAPTSLGAAPARVPFMARLQPRERTLVAALVVTFFAMSIIVLSVLRGARLEALAVEIEALEDALERVNLAGPTYKDRLAAKAKKDARVSDKPLVFSTVIEQAEAKAEVSTANQETLPPQEIAPGLQQSLVRFQMRDVRMDQLAKFLAAVESGSDQHVISTQSLLVRSPSGLEDRLNVDVELVTYQRVAITEGQAP